MLGKKTNVLLVKDDVGQAKPTTRNLPNDNFAFGRPNGKITPASEGKFFYLKIAVINEWHSHQASTINKPDPRDFKKLNKMSIREKQFTSPQFTSFRKSNDARVALGVINERTIKLPGEDFTYGRKNRPQTPVYTIIANNYGEEASQEL